MAQAPPPPSLRGGPETHPNYRPPVDLGPITLTESLVPKRSDIDPRGGNGAPSNAFLAVDLLSPSECAQLIAAAETRTPTKVDWEYDPEYRDCSRVVVSSRKLADALYDRLVPLFRRGECEGVRPFGFDGHGDWRPLKLNDVVRISRYDAGGHFRAHRDGAFVENDDVRSVFTVLVYLNQAPGFEGGSTNIYSSLAAATGSGGADAERVATAAVVDPVTGSALVMTHDTPHSGERVTSGRKYVARLDVMFHRLGGSMGEAELSRVPGRALAECLYASSIAKQRNGDPRGSTEDYVRALDLQAKLPSSTATARLKFDGDDASVFRVLPQDTFILCLRFLGLNDIAQASAVSQLWHEVCSSGLLWRELFMLRWPSFAPAESTIRRDAGTQRIPLAIHRPYLGGRWNGNPRTMASFSSVYVTVLPNRPGLLAEGEAAIESALYGGKGQGQPRGYMFSGLHMVNFPLKARKEFRWKHIEAMVNEGCIHFRDQSHRSPSASASAWRGVALDPPLSIPLLAETELFFSFRDSDNPQDIDSCIVRLPGAAGGYLAICMDDPCAGEKTGRYYWVRDFTGILDDVARILVVRQTERALRFSDILVRCDSKTKQWRTAYSRRHLAERLFDVVTVDVGSVRTKFASGSAVSDTYEDSFASLVANYRGHLWSAGHGLDNHIVGEGCRSGGHQPRGPYGKDGTPDFGTMAIICAHIVEKSPACRPRRRRGHMYHRTIAEHPINVVEPPMGFAERERLALIERMSTWNVPFVGFVNGAAAALMCGDEPRRDGIVVVLGGVNSAVVGVVGGAVVLGQPLWRCDSDDADPNVIAEEVCAAIRTVQASKACATIGVDGLSQVLLTGGRATDSVVAAVKASMGGTPTHIYVVSDEEERNFDAVRGGHILANLSDGRKHFRCVMNLMWALGVANGGDGT